MCVGISNVYSLFVFGGLGNIIYCVFGNYCNVDGILKNFGFEQFNGCVNFFIKVFNEKVSIDFNFLFINWNFDFGFNEVFCYGVLYNFIVLVFGFNVLFLFVSEQYGGFFEILGLFDSFNLVFIIE